MRKGLIVIWLVTGLGILTSIILTIIQDPFFIYHKPFAKSYYNFTNEAYQNPGIAKNFDYTNIISGSSMAENFQTSYFDEHFGGSTVKLCYSGESLKNKYNILNCAFSSKKHSDIKNVFICLDLWALIDDPDAVYNSTPSFLLDNTMLNDAGYLLNKDILIKDVIPNLKRNGKQPSQDMDSAFKWHGAPYGNFAIFQQWNIPKPWREEQEDSLYFDIAKRNLEQNIIPLLAKNPQTEFYFFYPPYSILYWYEKHCNGEVNALLEMKDLVNEQLLQYTNVHMYDFQWDENIITNLWNYKDTIHYGSNIQSLIAEEFQQNKYRVIGKEEIHKDKLKELIDNLDMEDYSNETLWEINNIYNYFNYIRKDNKYRVYMAVNNDSSKNWTNELDKLWELFGSDISLRESPESAYLMILEEGRCQYELFSQTPIEYTSPDNTIYMKSSGTTWDGYASIIINGVEYSQNSCGLNIVTYDLEKQCVVDSVCFDTSTGSAAMRMHGWR